jgi:hypothetical protein
MEQIFFFEYIINNFFAFYPDVPMKIFNRIFCRNCCQFEWKCFRESSRLFVGWRAFELRRAQSTSVVFGRGGRGGGRGGLEAIKVSSSLLLIRLACAFKNVAFQLDAILYSQKSPRFQPKKAFFFKSIQTASSWRIAPSFRSRFFPRNERVDNSHSSFPIRR